MTEDPNETPPPIEGEAATDEAWEGNSVLADKLSRDAVT
jgi:hypothetical protein